MEHILASSPRGRSVLMRRILSFLIACGLGLALITTSGVDAATSVMVDQVSRNTPTAVVAAAKAPSYSMYRGPNTGSRVALTYDDCPKSVASFKDTVNYATKHDIGLVLFPTGQCIGQFKKKKFDLVKYARERGHWVANHSYSHPDLTKLSKKKVIDQIDGTAVSNYGRPPYGAINSTVKKAYAAVKNYDRNGMRIWLWGVDTNDWKGKSRTQVVTYVVGNARAGSTVLMHMQWNGFSPKALKAMKKGLTKKDINLCRVWRGADKQGEVVKTSRVIPTGFC